jgi:SAM-dependent methyltransferase
MKETEDMLFQSDQMFNTTLTAKIYNLGKKIVSSDYQPKKHLEEFIFAIEPDAVVAELGSGNRRLTPNIINIDLFPFPNVDIIADITKTPLDSNSIDYLIIDAVLEHVPEPHKVVEEIYRIVKPGGAVYCLVPFVYPYHGYPHNYFNFSKDALDFLFRSFSSCSVEIARGPTSALTNLISEYIAVGLSGKSTMLYTFWKGVSLAPIFLLKYLDFFWNSTGPGVRIANALCAKVVK